MAEDLEFLNTLLVGCFKGSRIKKGLEKIGLKNITGWERWLEIELALYFAYSRSLSESKIQFTLKTDKRKTGKSKMKPDFALRRKKYAKNKFIMLELKCNNSTEKCIRGMLNDLHKFYKLRGKQEKDRKLRSFFVVGVHQKEKKSNIIKIIDNMIEKNQKYSKLDLDNKAIKTKKIAKTKYSFTLF